MNKDTFIHYIMYVCMYFQKRVSLLWEENIEFFRENKKEPS